MARLLQTVLPPACGFFVGYATRRRLSDAARTCLKKEEKEKEKGLRRDRETPQSEQKEKCNNTGRWCDCSSMAVVHRMYLSSSSFPDFAAAVRKLAAERTATPGFKGMYVFRRPLEQQAAAATAAAATAADAAAAAAAGEAAAGAGEDAAAVSRSDVVGAEFLLVEEWLNPLAAGEALNPPRGSRKEHNQMKGTLWACMAAGPL